jgi:hypothetical protein
VNSACNGGLSGSGLTHDQHGRIGIAGGEIDHPVYAVWKWISRVARSEFIVKCGVRGANAAAFSESVCQGDECVSPGRSFEAVRSAGNTLGNNRCAAILHQHNHADMRVGIEKD